MYAVEFKAKIKNGIITVTEKYRIYFIDSNVWLYAFIIYRDKNKSNIE